MAKIFSKFDENYNHTGKKKLCFREHSLAHNIYNLHILNYSII